MMTGKYKLLIFAAPRIFSLLFSFLIFRFSLSLSLFLSFLITRAYESDSKQWSPTASLTIHITRYSPRGTCGEES